MTRLITLAAVALSLTAVPLGAQQHEHPRGDRERTGDDRAMMCGHMQMMMGSMMDRQDHGGMEGMAMRGFMMDVMRFQPANILEHRAQLDLTDAQISRIEELMSGHPGGRAMMSEMRPNGEHLRELFEADKPDTVALRAAAERMAGMHAQMHATHLVRAALTRAVLAPAQRSRAAELATGCRMMEHGGR